LGNLDDLAVGGAAALIGMRGFRSIGEESATKKLVRQALIDDKPEEALRLLLLDAGFKFKEVRGPRH